LIPFCTAYLGKSVVAAPIVGALKALHILKAHHIDDAIMALSVTLTN
jgi:hypothetical protein